MALALELSGIRKSFDGFAALTDAHFSAHWGEVHALLGENGAGKSSLMNIAAGLYRPEAGTLQVDGHALQLGGPRDAARHRIGMVHQHFKLVQPFSVVQNVWLTAPRAIDRHRLGRWQPHRQRLRALADRIREQAAALGFEIDPERRVSSLSVAEQQRVEILKVLLAGARILILDEPTAVLTEQEAERLLQTLRGLARGGAAVVLVTHKMADVKRHADRVTVMRAGRTVASLDPRASTVAELVRLTVGDTAAPLAAAPPAVRGALRLALRGLRSGAAFGGCALNGVDLAVHGGEIYGLAGVGGNGQSELAGAIMGLPGDKLAGEIWLAGHGDLTARPASTRRGLGMAAIPADRYALALAGALSVAENHAIGQVHNGGCGPAWRLDRTRMRRDAEAAVQAFDVQGVRSVAQKAALLSGGNAQKLVLAREFGKAPTLVLAHSPSRGLDVRAAAAVHARLRAARAAGAAVLLISEDLDEVLQLADRVGVMARGRIVAEFSAAGEPAAQPALRQKIGSAMVDHG